jgi:hypothetical protein
VGSGVGSEPGGLIGLYGLVNEHCEAVEADLAFRGVDLRGLWTGALSWRRLKVLIDHLPPESATKTEIRESHGEEFFAEIAESSGPAPHGQWSRAEHLLATITDSVNDLSYLTLCMSIAKDKQRPERPARIPRPGVSQPVSSKPSAAALAYLAREREERRAHLTLVSDGA